jgi:acetyl esterase/lipase
VRLVGVVAVLTVSAGICPSDGLVNEKTMTLWPGTAPGALFSPRADIPALQVFLPAAEAATGSSIIICPGGSYSSLSPHEGGVIGEWLAKNGIAAFVLRYRLAPKYHYPVQLVDGQRAIRFVRSHAEQWKLDPARVGILGFSAGGHLASSTATHYTDGDPDSRDPVERVSSRPDLQILIYPVITMGPGTHQGSKNNLLGPNPSQELIDLTSNEKQVNEKTPPAFLVHSVKDRDVPVSNSDSYAQALKKYNVPYEYLRGELGGHGFGLADDWSARSIAWLRGRKF